MRSVVRWVLCLSFVLATMPVTTYAQSEDSDYLVRPGDSLWKIARDHGCSVEELQQANHLDGDKILAGERLVIPVEGRLAQPIRHSSADKVDSNILPKLMKKYGFRPPAKFKALVVEITFNRGRTKVVSERRYDYRGTSDDSAGWNPASTVKLYAAIAALQKVRSFGMTRDARVSFIGKRKKYSTTVRQLVKDAINESDNIAYNRLVQLAGFDYLHERFFTSRNGLPHSALMRAYEQSKWKSMGESVSLRNAPLIKLRQWKKGKKTIGATSGEAKVECYGAACTSLADLAEAMKRLMLQEQLPNKKTFRLETYDLYMLRKAMREERRRGNEVVDNLTKGYGQGGLILYSKPGYSDEWFSDNVYVYDRRQRRKAWIVTLAGYPGRNSLNQAASIFGKIIRKGGFEKSSR